MATALRRTGLGVVGDMPWGAHFCLFYKTKQDFLDTIVPYFKAGLASNEYCLWILSKSDPLTKRGFNSPVHRNLRASEGVKNLLR